MTDRQHTAMTNPDTARTEAGGRQDTTPEGLTVAEAAIRLAVTPDAIRRRLHHGTLAGAKTVDGEWRVWLPDGEADAPPGPSPGQLPGEHQDPARTPPAPQEATPHPAIEALLESQQAEIAYLREQLAERSRELAAERERFDVLHREALARITALGAGQDVSRAAPAVHHATDDVEAASPDQRPLREPGAPIGPPAWRTTTTTGIERKPWWREWWERWP